MPYDTLSELPDAVRGLPKRAQEIYQAAFNNAWKEYDGEEARCHAVAWSAVKRQYEKGADGKWHLRAGKSQQKTGGDNMPKDEETKQEGGEQANAPPDEDELKDAALKEVWTAAEINNLPDDAFLWIELGGEKDKENKTTPRALRHFPVMNQAGELDFPHCINAIARIPQSNAPGLTPEKKAALQEKARGLLETAKAKVGKAIETGESEKTANPAEEPQSILDEAKSALKEGRTLSAATRSKLQSLVTTMHERLADIQGLLETADAEPAKAGILEGLIPGSAVKADPKDEPALLPEQETERGSILIQEDDAEALVTWGGEVKALGGGRVGGPLITFSGPEDPDLSPERDFFCPPPGTDYVTDFPTTAATWFNHAQPMQTKSGRLVAVDHQLSHPTTLTLRPFDIWAETLLDERDEYEKFLLDLAKQGKLGWSSGAPGHLVRRKSLGNANQVLRWPIGSDASLTHRPAEPRNHVVSFKSLPIEIIAEDAPGAQEGGIGKADKETKQAESQAVKSDPEAEGVHTEEVTNMGDTINVEDIAKKAAGEAVEAMWKKLEAEPPKPIGGVALPSESKDASYAFKSLGEFLQCVHKAGTEGPVDPRLASLAEPGEEGYSLTKAMGPQFVGSLYGAAIKAPSGLGLQPESIGGFLTTTDRAAGLMARVYNIGELLRRVDMVGVSATANAMTFNAEDETSRVAGSRRGGIQAYWGAEAAQKSGSYPKFRQMELKLKKVYGLVYATDELLADANALEGWIMTNLPEEIRFVVEDAIINGLGGGVPLGILNSGAVVSVAKEAGQAAKTVVAENIWNMYSRMWVPSLRNAVWLINQDVWPQLYSLYLAGGAGSTPVFLPPGGLSVAPYGTLLGLPVIPCEYCATLGTVGDILFVDLRQYQMIEKGGIQSASSIHIRFLNDETVFRFTYRCDGQFKWNAALTPYKGTNTVSPAISLAVRS